MIRVFSASRINLNLSNASVNGVDQIKGRDFEVPGCRGFIITKELGELRRYYRFGVEIETYSSVPELIEKIHHYLGDDAAREAIAEAGYRRTLRDHTMERRLTEVLTRVIEGPQLPADLSGGETLVATGNVATGTEIAGSA
jgi:spore maturation protein CgeB